MPGPFAALLPLAGKLLGGTALRGLATAGARQGAAVAAKEGGKAAAKTAAKEGGKQLAQEAAKESAKRKDFAMNQALNTLQQSHQMNQQKDAEHLRRVQDHAQSSQQGTTTGFGQ